MTRSNVPRTTKEKTTEKDFREKKLEDFDDVFCDIINGLLFQGNTVLPRENWKLGCRVRHTRLTEKFEEQERDVKKSLEAGTDPACRIRPGESDGRGSGFHLPGFQVRRSRIPRSGSAAK